MTALSLTLAALLSTMPLLLTPAASGLVCGIHTAPHSVPKVDLDPLSEPPLACCAPNCIHKLTPALGCAQSEPKAKPKSGCDFAVWSGTSREGCMPDMPRRPRKSAWLVMPVQTLQASKGGPRYERKKMEA